MPERILRFAEFALDIDRARLLREGTSTPLAPKDLALLRHLLSNPRRVLSHRELLDAVWGGTAVQPDVLKVRVARLRRLLGDDADTPRFIANVHGEGYCFLEGLGDDAGSGAKAQATRPTAVVGRREELGALHLALNEAAQGRRQVVAISGPAGIGKTTLVDTFVHGDPSRRGGRASTDLCRWTGAGQCLEQYGRAEPFLPIMEALGRLASTDHRGRLKAALKKHAPTWLLQMPALVSDEEQRSLQQRVVSPSADRVLRDLSEAFEALDRMANAEGPATVLGLTLEDIHWADASTLDLLRMLARRRDPLRMLIVVTYRPSDVGSNSHPLRKLLHDLRTQQRITEIQLGPLGGADIVEYLDQQYPGNEFATQLAPLLLRRTEGHPLFVDDLVRDLRARGVIDGADGSWTFRGDAAGIEALMPASVRQLMAQQRDELSEADRSLLEAASVAGPAFSSAAAAAAIEADIAVVEARCCELADREMFLRRSGVEEWPDGTVSMRFTFLHALHHELWRERAAGRRGQQWRLRIAQRLEAAYVGRTQERAVELAVLFEEGRDAWRAIDHYADASHRALQRGAHREARDLLTRAFDLMALAPESPERQQRELRLRIELGSMLALTEGFRSPAAAEHFQRADALSGQVGDAPQLVDASFGLCRFFWIRGEFVRAQGVAEHMLAMTRNEPESAQMMVAATALGSVLLGQGNVAQALPTLRRAYDLTRHHWRHDLLQVYSSDLQVVCAASLGSASMLAGRIVDAYAYDGAARKQATLREHPISQGAALLGAALQGQFRGDRREVKTCVDAFQALAATFDLPDFVPLAEMFGGWASVNDGQAEDGLTHLTAAAGMFRAFGVGLYLPYALGLLAEAQYAAGHANDARASLTEALDNVAQSGTHFYEAELWRIRAEFAADRTEAEDCFERACAVARTQGTTWWELRAVLGLARSQDRQGRGGHARAMLAKVVALFTDRIEVGDLKAARSFLSH